MSGLCAAGVPLVKGRMRVKADGRVYRRERRRRGYGWRLVGLIVRTKSGSLLGRVTFGGKLDRQ